MPELPRNLPHLYLRGSGKAEPYTTRLRPRGRPLPQRERAVHAEAVRLALAGAMAAAAVERGEREPDILTGTPGFYLDFELPARIGRRSGTAGESSKTHRTRRGPAGIRGFAGEGDRFCAGYRRGSLSQEG